MESREMFSEYLELRVGKNEEVERCLFEFPVWNFPTSKNARGMSVRRTIFLFMARSKCQSEIAQWSRRCQSGKTFCSEWLLYFQRFESRKVRFYMNLQRNRRILAGLDRFVSLAYRVLWGRHRFRVLWPASKVIIVTYTCKTCLTTIRDYD